MTGRQGALDNGNECRTSLVPLAFPCFVLCLIRVETEGLLDYQGRGGIISIVRWNLRPVIFGVKSSKKPFSLRFGPTFRPFMLRPTRRTGNLATFALRGLLVPESCYFENLLSQSCHYCYRLQIQLGGHFEYSLYFFLLGEGEGGVRGGRKGRGSVFLLKIPGGGGGGSPTREGGGRGAGRVSAGKCGGGELNISLGAEKHTKSEKLM